MRVLFVAMAIAVMAATATGVQASCVFRSVNESGAGMLQASAWTAFTDGAGDSAAIGGETVASGEDGWLIRAAAGPAQSVPSWRREPPRFPLLRRETPEISFRCLPCYANPLYWQSVGILKLAQGAGAINNIQECRTTVSDAQKLSVVVATVFGGSPPSWALTALSAIVGVCGNCACDTAF
jgi:hypothetical protein